MQSVLVTPRKSNLPISAVLFLPLPDKGSFLPYLWLKWDLWHADSLTDVGLSLGIRILLVIEITLGTLSSFSNAPYYWHQPKGPSIYCLKGASYSISLTVPWLARRVQRDLNCFTKEVVVTSLLYRWENWDMRNGTVQSCRTSREVTKI